MALAESPSRSRSGPKVWERYLREKIPPKFGLISDEAMAKNEAQPDQGVGRSVSCRLGPRATEGIPGPWRPRRCVISAGGGGGMWRPGAKIAVQPSLARNEKTPPYRRSRARPRARKSPSCEAGASCCDGGIRVCKATLLAGRSMRNMRACLHPCQGLLSSGRVTAGRCSRLRRGPFGCA
jgi:hypothetical protein